MLAFFKILCLVTPAMMLFPGSFSQAQAQKQGQVIVLGPEVGETIDQEEGERYGLFPASQSFHSAMIIQRPDGSIVAEMPLPEDCHVRLQIYNLLGQQVATLADDRQAAGERALRWDAGGLASGIYLCRLTAGDFTQTRKMMLMK